MTFRHIAPAGFIGVFARHGALFLCHHPVPFVLNIQMTDVDRPKTEPAKLAGKHRCRRSQRKQNQPVFRLLPDGGEYFVIFREGIDCRRKDSDDRACVIQQIVSHAEAGLRSLDQQNVPAVPDYFDQRQKLRDVPIVTILYIDTGKLRISVSIFLFVNLIQLFGKFLSVKMLPE